MNYGFVKVAAAVPRVKVADCKFNSERLEGLITIAEGTDSHFSRNVHYRIYLWRLVRPATFA